MKSIEYIKLDVDILKTKLMFFASIVGGTVFLFINIDKISKFINQYILYFSFVIVGFYAIIGVIVSLSELNIIKKSIGSKNEL